MTEPAAAARSWQAVLALLLLAAAVWGAAAEDGEVIVGLVTPGGAGDRAGLRPGDRLLAWQRAASPPASPNAAAGEIESPFDVILLETEQAPRGPVALSIERRGALLSLTLPPGDWQIETRPRLSPDELRTLREALAGADGSPVDSIDTVRKLAATAAARDETTLAVWYEIRAGQLAIDQRRYAEAEAAFAHALALVGYDPQWVRARYRALKGCVWARRWLRKFDGAISCHEESLQLARDLPGDGLLVADCLYDRAMVAWQRGDLAAAEELLRQVLAARQRLAPGSVALTKPSTNLAFLIADRGAFAEAEALLQRNLEILQRLEPDSIGIAEAISHLGQLALKRDDLETAEELLRRAVIITEQLAPGSEAVATRLNRLALVVFQRGEAAAAEELFRRAYAIRRRVAASSSELVTDLNGLATARFEQGDLAAAEQLFRQSLQEAERLGLFGRRVASTLNNLGSIAFERGHLAAAERYYRRALGLLEEYAPDSVHLANTLNSLGKVAEHRGDMAAAEDAYLAALRLNQKLVPDSLDLALTLVNLGSVLEQDDRLAEAEEHYRQALAIRQRLAPGYTDVATTLELLGALVRRRGDLAAEQLLERALAMRQRVHPGSLFEAASQRELGDLALARGELPAAEGFFRRALELREQLAPGSDSVAESYHDLARVLRAAGRIGDALPAGSRAVELIEAQRERIGGTERSRSTYRARHLGYFHDLLLLLRDSGRDREAFAVLERSRARGMLEMLAERDLVFAADLPAELEQERSMAATTYDRLQVQLAELSPASEGEQLEQLRRRMRELHRRQEEIAEEVRRRSPRLAALRYPQVLDADGVLDVLDPGTLLLAYAFARERTLLFVISAVDGEQRPFAVLELDTGRDQIESLVRAYRLHLAEEITPGRADSSRERLRQRGRRLYEVLLAPAEPWVQAAERLLICPDGSLHTLPFAALVCSQGDREQYLVEWKPLHTVLSGTLYAQLRQQPPGEHSLAAGTIALFGDPVYPANGRIEHLPLLGVNSITPLPATRHEVEAVAAVWGKAARTFIGSAAREEQVKTAGETAHVLHLACHGILDEQVPLDSALVLTVPEAAASDRDNGLLQAWEIFEEVRLGADLVVLSACDTALGAHLGGEGLVGLTRAFQYAGARSIVASLWSVPDSSTAVLMASFHAALRRGTSIDEALRQAQLELINEPATIAAGEQETTHQDTAHPFAWAGFVLIGDRRWQVPGKTTPATGSAVASEQPLKTPLDRDSTPD